MKIKRERIENNCWQTILSVVDVKKINNKKGENYGRYQD